MKLRGAPSRYRPKVERVGVNISALGRKCLDAGVRKFDGSMSDYIETLIRKDNPTTIRESA